MGHNTHVCFIEVIVKYTYPLVENPIMPPVKKPKTTVEHKLGQVLFHYIDRMSDRTPEDNGDRIIDEILPELDAIIYINDPNERRWYCGKCRQLNKPKENIQCDCWNDKEWNK